MNDKSPSRKAGELDNRGSHYYLAMYWAKELSEQSKDDELKNIFAPIAKELAENEVLIVNELNATQGKAIDIDGYYFPNEAKAASAMRPCEIFNNILTHINLNV